MDILNTIIIDGLSFALPLFIMAIGGIYSERSGVLNLALEGLQGMGAFIGALAITFMSGLFTVGSQLPMYLSFGFAILGGMAYGAVHAWLCIRFKANQIIASIVINTLAIALTGFLTSQLNATVFGAPGNSLMLSTSRRFSIPFVSEIPVLGSFFTNIYPFEIIILVVAVIAWYFLYKTPFGLHLRACGDNPHAVDAAGIDVAKVRFKALVICGGLSAIGGMSFAYSISAQFAQTIYVGYGYLAIAALIFGNWKILPTFGACLIFGFARSSGFVMTQVWQLPVAFSDIFMTLPYIVTLLLLIFFAKTTRVPKALGEIYDKGKR